MKYPYHPVGPDPVTPRRFLWMPLVKATLSGPKGSRNLLALVDSGASYCLAPRRYADLIGAQVDESKAVPTYGVTGLAQAKPAYPAHVKVKVEHLPEVDLLVYFMETDAFAFILGQRDFFDRFRITFEKLQYIFEIVPMKK